MPVTAEAMGASWPHAAAIRTSCSISMTGRREGGSNTAVCFCCPEVRNRRAITATDAPNPGRDATGVRRGCRRQQEGGIPPPPDTGSAAGSDYAEALAKFAAALSQFTTFHQVVT